MEFVQKSDLVSNPLAETLDAYMKTVQEALVCEHKSINSKSSVKFVYSAMHGVGYNYIVKAFEAANLSVIPVVEQKDPDPDFPTVK